MSNVFAQIGSELDAGRPAVCATLLGGGPVVSRPVKRVLVQDRPGGGWLGEEAREALDSGRVLCSRHGSQRVVIEPFYPRPQLIVLGGGHVALPVVDLGVRLGFSVTVVDDRPEFACHARFPQASRIICRDFLQAFNDLPMSPSSYVVIITRGHEHDVTCLRQALKRRPAYIGMIGSERKVRATRQHLLAEGFGEGLLNTVCAPVGLRIGSVTPEEIAVSVMAQLVCLRRLRRTSEGTGAEQKRMYPDTDLHVIRELATPREEPRAVITVVAASGSAPREAGAKMVTWADGRSLGTVGGGQVEGRALAAGRDVAVRDGRPGYRFLQFDLEDEFGTAGGALCGGQMEVLVEAWPPEPDSRDDS